MKALFSTIKYKTVTYSSPTTFVGRLAIVKLGCHNSPVCPVPENLSYQSVHLKQVKFDVSQEPHRPTLTNN